MSINLTEKAANEVKRYMDEHKEKMPGDAVLRVGVMGGGCSGFQYDFRFDNTFDDKVDSKYQMHGITLVVDKKSELYLDGTTIDFYEDLDKRGFQFHNPQATRSCGCGSSFQV